LSNATPPDYHNPSHRKGLRKSFVHAQSEPDRERLPDPATTPVKPLRQALFAIAIAAVYGVLLVEHVVYGLFIALAIVSAMRCVGLYAWAGWQFIRANPRGPLMLQPGMAGTAKGMSTG